jgi:hypothetical protein
MRLKMELGERIGERKWRGGGVDEARKDGRFCPFVTRGGTVEEDGARSLEEAL